MRNEFTAIVERAGRWHIAYCPEIPGANGQGRTKAAAMKSLANAIALILEDRRKDGLRGVPASARAHLGVRGIRPRHYGRTGLPYRIVVDCSRQEQSHRR